jgi:hypothetical protein
MFVFPRNNFLFSKFFANYFSRPAERKYFVDSINSQQMSGSGSFSGITGRFREDPKSFSPIGMAFLKSGKYFLHLKNRFLNFRKPCSNLGKAFWTAGQVA